MALATSPSARRARGRLRWKGLDVSDEFRSYADRVARGEDLPPFQGKILAEPDSAFPWDPKQQRREQSRVLRRQLGLWTGVALFLGVCIWVLVVQVGNQSDATQRAAESPLATVVLGNQPAAPEPDVAPAAPSALEATPAPERAAELSAAAGAGQGTTALASLQERTAPGAPTAAAVPSVSAPRAATPSSLSTSSVAPASHAGAMVATRPAGAPGQASLAAAGIIRTPPEAFDVAGGANGRVPGAGGASATPSAGSPIAGSPIAGSPIAGNGVAAASASAASAGPIASTPTASASADPKKEPGREASTTAPLLVETPSF